MIINMITTLLKGGGLETESGTWSPTHNTARGTINFTNTHDEPPAAFVVWDTGDTTSGISAVFEVCFDYEALFGEELTGRASSYKATRYGLYYSSSTSSSNFIKGCLHGRSDTGDSDDNYYRYHATESCIRPLVLSGSSYGWRSARTYKWIAIWV